MKLLQPNAGTITNSELIQVLVDRGADGTGKALISEKLAHQYLIHQPVKQLSNAQLQAFFDVLQPYKLTRGELLQLVNLGPRTAVEVFLVVADCEARLGDDGVDAVLAAVEAHVAREMEGEQDGGAAGADGDGAME